jgi:rRNA maturation RNase YbeY
MKKVLSALGHEDTELSISLVTDDEIAQINADYLDRKGPTNVISFPFDDAGPNPAHLLGEVVVSIDTAERIAKETGRQRYMMIDYYLIHGILHLVGYDHEGDDPQQAEKMEKKQDQLWRFVRSRKVSR